MSLNTLNSQLIKSENEVVICYAKRTPLCMSITGSFKDCCIEDLLTPLLKDAYWSLNLPSDRVGDIVIGNALTIGGANLSSRVSQSLAGIPLSIPLQVSNRQSASGLNAISIVFNAIKNGRYEIGIVGGVESMTIDSKEKVFDKSNDVYVNDYKENKEFNSKLKSREECDKFALNSYEKAKKAYENGYLREEIIPITVELDGKSVLIQKDDSPSNMTLKYLKSLKLMNKDELLVTEGNCSKQSDGVSVIVMASRKVANELNLKILGSIKDYLITGTTQDNYKIDPTFTILSLLSKNKLKSDNIDLWEINESSASECLYIKNKLGINDEKINVNGGAIAIGNPMGCTGVRMISTLLAEMNRRHLKRGIVYMSVELGMGFAAIFEIE